jgi:hypothetical protein
VRLTLTLLRHTLTLALEPDDEEQPAAEREGSADAYVERAHPDDRSRNAEMDGRPFGFRGETS